MSRTAQPGVHGSGEPGPNRAPVVPRCRLLPSEADLPIDRQLRSLLTEKKARTVMLVGPAGSGKSTALAYLAASLSEELGVILLDEQAPAPDRPPPDATLVVQTAAYVPNHCKLPTLHLSPWNDDDLIEYMLATHPGRCRAVMEKLKALPGRETLKGLPELWRIVLDEMAADDRVADIETAFARFLARELSDPEALLAAERECLWQLIPWGDKTPFDGCEARVARIIRHQPVKVMLAARGLVRSLCAGEGEAELRGGLSQELIDHASRLLGAAPEAADYLRALLSGRDETVQPMAASLLHAAGTGWRPTPPSVPRLAGALLTAARWPGVDLSGAQMDRVRFTGANLSRARMAGANLVMAHLSSACLRNAGLFRARLSHAYLNRADLTGVLAEEADFTGAVLESALLNDASMRLAVFRTARLERAMFMGANLKEADFTDATIEDTCFARADLSGAVLTRLTLRSANLDSAVLKMANLAQCDLEAIEATNVDFSAACLTNALLTGSVLRGGSFRNATLRGCGLAEIDWEGADLRDADLRGSTFHMGSTRSGLVNSDTPCEGSRTGFYTDDYFDRDYKDPRDVRKANLRNADLRGAIIDEVDFYLVDLRGARYTNSQAQWFVRCGAILSLG